MGADDGLSRSDDGLRRSYGMLRFTKVSFVTIKSTYAEKYGIWPPFSRASVWKNSYETVL